MIRMTLATWSYSWLVVKRNLHLRCLPTPQFEAEPVPSQRGTRHLEVTNVVLVMGFNVAEPAIGILELPLDEYVSTVAVFLGLEEHLEVVAVL
ncbi:MAG: hypothetical protein ABIK09_19920 [Pseudomonadota bacterium]